MGAVTLYPHQVSAVQRIRRTLHEFGGALLCDAVGLGKTYTALAVATAYGEPLIIAPAILGTMWQQALGCTGVRASFCSIEALSRGANIGRRYAIIIVDEAHHLRNPGTRRYAAVAQLCIRTPVLLMSATPIHNSRADLTSLAALFMGDRAESLDAAALGRIVVRRTGIPGRADSVPRVEHAPWHVITTDDDILDRIMGLPPPVPPADGGQATQLVTLGLARQYTSSSAALLGALRRRVARSHALIAALDSGRYPTRAELQAWVFADGALQLAFPELLPRSDADIPELRDAVTAHLEGLRALALYLAATHHDTDQRAGFVRRVMNAHAGEKVVAFTGYKETASALYHLLARDGGVALMTSAGGTVIGGALTRRETLERFAPYACSVGSPNKRDQIRLLLTTDLLSEGVNLQDASVVIHLDLPWTHARLQQRIGRVARLGSRHAVVTSYVLRPSERAEALLSTMGTLERKGRTATAVFGAEGERETTEPPGRSGIELLESIRSTLEQWLQCGPADRDTGNTPATSPAGADTPLVACISAQATGAIVACVVNGRAELAIVNSALRVSTDATAVRAALAQAIGPERAIPLEFASRVHGALVRWRERERAAIDAGVDSCIAGVVSTARKRAAIRTADAATEAGSFAMRGARSKRASLLRSAAARPMPLALEQLVYANPLDSSLHGDEFVGTVDFTRGNTAAGVDTGPRVVAMLLMDGFASCGGRRSPDHSAAMANSGPCPSA